MVKSIEFITVGRNSIKELPKKKLVNIPQQIEEIVAKNVQTVDEIPAECYRAKIAPRVKQPKSILPKATRIPPKD